MNRDTTDAVTLGILLGIGLVGMIILLLGFAMS
jgi:preprotein translocase subunit Sss1